MMVAVRCPVSERCGEAMQWVYGEAGLPPVAVSPSWPPLAMPVTVCHDLPHKIVEATRYRMTSESVCILLLVVKHSYMLASDEMLRNNQ